MNRKATLLVLAVFVLGIVLGGLLMLAVEQRVMSQQRGNGRKGPGSARLVEDLTRELSLTPEQQQRLTAELEETRRRYDAIFETIRPQMEQTRQDGRARIRAVLTQEQLPKFEEYLRRMDERRKREAGK
jgi:Spy/CpxP family protein refolding chaperone